MELERQKISRARGAVRQQITKLNQKVAEFCATHDSAAEWTLDIDTQLTAWVAAVQRHDTKLQELNARFSETLVDEENQTIFDAECEACQDYAEKIDMTRAAIEAFRRMYGPDSRVSERRNAGHVSGGESGVGENVGRCLEKLVTMQEDAATGAVQLPTTKLTRFGGAGQDFLTFLDEFRRLVHERTGFSDLQKHKLLRDLVTGEAAKTLSGLVVTGEAYAKALHLLLQRYGCVESILYGVLSKLNDLPRVVKSHDIGGLRNLLDKINHIVLTLTMLDFDEMYYGASAYLILLRAIPQEMSIKFVSRVRVLNEPDLSVPPNLVLTASGEITKTFVMRFKQLCDFIAEEVATLEQQRDLCPIARSRESARLVGAGPRRLDGQQPAALVYANSAGLANGNADGRGGQTGAGKGRSIGEVGGGAGPSDARGSWKRDVSTNGECAFCAGEHKTLRCGAAISVKDRRQLAKQKGLCWRCLETGHSARRCSSKGICEACQGYHHKLVCSKLDVNTMLVRSCSEGLLPTGHVEVCGENGAKSVTRFLLDSGSQRSFISARLTEYLQLKPICHESLYLHVFGNDGTPEPQRLPVVRVQLTTKKGDLVGLLALVVKSITADTLPSPSARLRRKLLEVELAERERGPTKVELLLNAADSFQLMDGKRERLDDGTLLVGSRLGTVIVGTGNNPVGALAASVTIPCLDRFFSLESLGIRPNELEPAADLNGIAERFKESITRLPNGRYQVKMNLRANVNLLEPNTIIASRQLKALGRRLQNDVELKRDYVREIRVFIDQGFAERLPTDETPKYLMPHFPVVQPGKLSYRVRPVFNASSAAKGKLSLNDCIENTLNLLPCPLRVLTNFRKYDFAWTGDISKAYLMVQVDPDQRNYLCFLWFADENTLSGEAVYRMTSTSFGVKDSQHNTITVIHEHAKRFESLYPEASAKVQSDLYMDDCLTGAQSSEDAKRLWREVTTILEDAGMTLKKFQSNCPELRRLMNVESSEPSALARPDGLTKVLGVAWDPEEDVLMFSPENMLDFVATSASTMRTLMGACARLFDPQGLLSPMVMVLKQVLQEGHLAKLGLDEQLPDEIKRRWLLWCEDLKLLAEVKFPRCLKFQQQGTLTELHAFSDASQRAFAAVVYLKAVTSDGESHVSLIASKAKLAPLKQLETLTIPRKELMAAALSVRLAKKVQEYLDLGDSPIYYWSDAQVVLHWIHSATPDRWNVFVRNRLIEILKHSRPDQWSHCKGSFNPADLPSRGVGIGKLKGTKLWFEGPPFLVGPTDKYPVFKQDPMAAEAIPEARTLIAVVGEPVFDPSRFSSLRRMVRVAAWVLRACERFRKGKQSTELARGPLLAFEINTGKTVLLKEAQGRCLGETVAELQQKTQPSDPALAAFAPFVDSQGLIRVGGRLQAAPETYAVRHPVLLRDDPLTRLIIMDAHCGRVMHMKTEAVLNEIRSQFWVIRARPLVKTVIRSCVNCRRDGGQVAVAQEAPLPKERVTVTFRPFETTGLDYFGPVGIKTDNGTKKVWVALFTCAVIRAVHLEVVEDMTASSCLAAIRRFVALHGVPSKIVSDNALAFKKASKCLTALWKALRSDLVQNFFGQRAVEWVFNAPRSPWWGGFFERLVGVTKSCLRRMLGLRQITLVEMVTLLHEVAAVVNQRPLTRVSDRVDEPQALTPSMFLAPRVPMTLPSGSLEDFGNQREGLVKIWRQREALLNFFWKRWRAEYLLVLRTAVRRNSGNGVTLSPGDVVLMERDGVPRAFWRLGRIEEEFVGRDGRARAYKVSLGNGRFVTRAGKCLVKFL